MDASRTTDATIGALAGLIAGSGPTVILIGQSSLDAAHPLGSDPSGVGWLAYLAIAVVGGGCYGALFGFQPRQPAGALGGGLLFGLLWWALVWLTIVPLVEADGPRWSVGEAAASIPLLIASIIFGGLTALIFYAASSRLAGQRAERRSIASSDVPVSHRIVILGGGFGGVATAQRLEHLLAHRPGVEVTLVSDSNFLLFTPMLAEVASSSLGAHHVAAPLRAACPRTTIRRATVEGVDLDAQSVLINESAGAPPERLPFDELVVAVGAVPAFHGLPGVSDWAFTLKSLADAADLRDRVIRLLDQAETEPDADTRTRLLTIVVAGGGFAGVELIAELHDLVLGVLVYYPRIEPADLRFVLVHSRDRILAELSEELGAYALDRLRRRGIEFRLGVRVASASAESIRLSDGTSIPSETFVWTAGNEPAPLLRSFASGLGARGLVTDDALRVVGLDHVWAVGDCARIPDPGRGGEPCPPTAQHAIRQGRLAAENIVATLDGRPARPFRFRTLGTLVVLGHTTAAAEIRGRRFSGLLAWFMWRGIYLTKLPGFEKKVRVLIDWLLDLVFPRDIVVARTAEPRAAPLAERLEGDHEPIA